MKIERARYEISQVLTPISQSLVPDDSVDLPGMFLTRWETGTDELKKIEYAARFSHMSHDRTSEDRSSAINMATNLISRGHESVLEHVNLSVIFTCDRAFSHELVRHRHASFTELSQRYCNFSDEKFGSEITFIQPWWMDDEEDIGYTVWHNSCQAAENAYFELLEHGYSPQQARMVLPNCTKTIILATANYREWRHILSLRTAYGAHPDMRHLMNGLLKELKSMIPVIFDDIQGYEPDTEGKKC